VVLCFSGEGRVREVVILIIEVHVVNAGHGIDDIERAVESALVILKHRLVEGALNYGANIVPILFEDSVEIINIKGSENDAE
jgi:hypothetical protein